jgi:hypothetical protein
MDSLDMLMSSMLPRTDSTNPAHSDLAAFFSPATKKDPASGQVEEVRVALVRSALSGAITYLYSLGEADPTNPTGVRRSHLSTKKNVEILSAVAFLLPDSDIEYKVAVFFCLMRIMPNIMGYYFQTCEHPVPTHRQAVLSRAIHFYADAFCRETATVRQVYQGLFEALMNGKEPVPVAR